MCVCVCVCVCVLAQNNFHVSTNCFPHQTPISLINVLLTHVP